MMNPYTYYVPLQFSSYYLKTKRLVKKSAKYGMSVLLKITGLNFILERKKEAKLPVEDIAQKRPKVLMYGVDLF